MDKVIVTRHEGALRFIKQELPEFQNAKVIKEARYEDVKGKDIAGNLPIELAAHANSISMILFEKRPSGKDLSIDDMYRCGAHIETFTVHSHNNFVDCPFCGTKQPKSWFCHHCGSN